MPLGYLTVPLPVLERTYQEAFHDSGLASFGRALLPRLGVDINETVIRNHSLTLEETLEETVDFTAKTLAAQQKYVDPLAKATPDNRTAPD